MAGHTFIIEFKKRISLLVNLMKSLTDWGTENYFQTTWAMFRLIKLKVKQVA